MSWQSDIVNTILSDAELVSTINGNLFADVSH